MITRNAQIARAGNRAEQLMCTNADVRTRLETHFKKPIAKIDLIKGRKKSDNLLTFADGTTCRIQNKDGHGGGRGWSADRRDVSSMPIGDTGKDLLSVVCLKRPGERVTVDSDPNLIRHLLLGTDPEYTPDYFTHSIFHKETGELLSLSIASADRVINSLLSTAYPQLVAKRTCVHIGPLMYLQRKGGGAADNAPDDIQLKLKSLPDVMELV